MSSAKIFIYRPHIQSTNQITLLCDGKDHCKYRNNVAKPVCGNRMKPTTLNAESNRIRIYFLEWLSSPLKVMFLHVQGNELEARLKTTIQTDCITVSEWMTLVLIFLMIFVWWSFKWVMFTRHILSINLYENFSMPHWILCARKVSW